MDQITTMKITTNTNVSANDDHQINFQFFLDFTIVLSMFLFFDRSFFFLILHTIFEWRHIITGIVFKYSFVYQVVFFSRVKLVLYFYTTYILWTVSLFRRKCVVSGNEWNSLFCILFYFSKYLFVYSFFSNLLWNTLF